MRVEFVLRKKREERVQQQRRLMVEEERKRRRINTGFIIITIHSQQKWLVSLQLVMEMSSGSLRIMSITVTPMLPPPPFHSFLGVSMLLIGLALFMTLLDDFFLFFFKIKSSRIKV